MPSVTEQRRQLAEDAERARSGNVDGYSQEWIDPTLWKAYCGKRGEELYESFSDQELLDILREAVAELGRLPSQKEVFCVYRCYIRKRFKNWPTALRAAGLKDPKPVRDKKRRLKREKRL